jgi:hypothetical protein
VSGQLHAQAALLPGKEPPVPIGQEVGWTPELVWTTCRTESSWTYQDSNSELSAVHPIASRYTDWAIPVPQLHSTVSDYYEASKYYSNDGIFLLPAALLATFSPINQSVSIRSYSTALIYLPIFYITAFFMYFQSLAPHWLVTSLQISLFQIRFNKTLHNFFFPPLLRFLLLPSNLLLIKTLLIYLHWYYFILKSQKSSFTMHTNYACILAYSHPSRL